MKKVQIDPATQRRPTSRKQNRSAKIKEQLTQQVEVQVIPAKAEMEGYEKPKPRVCAYCRVSTDMDTQALSYSIDALQSVAAELRKEESDLAELLMQRLIPESAFRTEQRRIKAQIAELTAKINEQRGKTVRESDFTIITEFDPEKVEKFITKVIVRKWTVTFVFYNGVEITKPYTNGPSGNQVGWKHKKEVAAWQ